MEQEGRQLREIYQDIVNAFDALVRYIEEEISKVLQDGTQCYESEAFSEAEKRASSVESLRGILKKLEGLRQEWDGAEEHRTDEPRPRPSRRPRGKGSPKSDFFRPILETLVESGGVGHVDEIYSGVHRRMDGMLRQADYERLRTSQHPRWKTTVRSARWELVKSGMLKKGSPRGTWEITETGRARVQ